MPGPFPVEVDVTVWQGREVVLDRIECDPPQARQGSTAINCHVHFDFTPAEAPEPAVSSVGFGVLALAAVWRRRRWRV